MKRNLRSNSKAVSSNLVVEEDITEESMVGDQDQSENMSGSNLQTLVEGLTGDPSRLCELLVKNLSIAFESNQQMHKLLQEQALNSSNRTVASFGKLDNCPVKGKYSSLDAWIQEVELWDDTNSSSCNIENLSAKKYLKFMESVKNSEDCEELKKLIQVEFKENQTFNKKSDSIIKDMIKVIREKLDKSDLEKCSDAWLKFINVKQETGESAQSYVIRFEQIETQLRNVKIIIPNKALAIHLLNKSSLQSKENILNKTILDDEVEIYNSLKKSVREIKSSMTVNDSVSKDNTCHSASDNKT